MDRILRSKLEAEPSSLIKCRNNYRHLYDLCSYYGDGMNVSHDLEWIRSALFLAWDRYCLDGMPLDEELIGQSTNDEVYKLLGLPREEVDQVTVGAFALYASLGGLKRLTFH
jgi:hypothetical protein